MHISESLAVNVLCMSLMPIGPSGIQRAAIYFLGHSEEAKGYRLYNPLTKKVIVSRDVVFNEQLHQLDRKSVV